MFKQVIGSMNIEILPTIALILFVSVFAGASVWVFRKRSKEIYHDISVNALDDGELK